MRINATRGAWLFALMVAACSASHGAESSTSGSNWLRCQALPDCAAANAASCSGEGYCLDARGERIAAPDARGEGGVSSQSYTLCDGSSDIRLAVVVGGGVLEIPDDFTSPYGESFLFVDGSCHYYARRSGLLGTVEGQLTPAQAAQFTQSVGLSQLAQRSYHDLEACLEADAFWVRAGNGYAGCNCGCDASAPGWVAPLMDAARAMRDELVDAGRALEGDVEVFALAPGGPGAPRSSDLSWPFSWPISEVSMTAEELDANGSVPKPRTLRDQEARTARALRDQVIAMHPDARRFTVVQDSLAYLVFLGELLPAQAQQGIERVMRAQIEDWEVF